MSNDLVKQHAAFMEALSVANRKMRKLYNARVAELGLTFARARVLTLLARHQTLNQSMLACELELEQPTLVRMLDRMAELDLVERLADPSDRRARLVRLRPHGEAMARRLIEEIRPGMAKSIFAPEDMAEMQAATELFRKIIARAEQYEAHDDE